MGNDRGAAQDLLELCLPHKVVSLVGLSKYSGKTTVLRQLIHAYHRNLGDGCPLAVTSVGYGGEVWLYAGMFAATAAGLLRDCDFTRRILHTTGINTPLGEVVVTEALTGGRAGLAGPSINSQLSYLVRHMLSDLGAGRVFIDGAGDKRTFAADSDGVILCIGAAFSSDMRQTTRECAHIHRLMSLPIIDTCSGEAVHINGALTDNILSDIAQENINTAVVAEDSSKVFIKAEALERFLHRGGRLFVKKPSNLIAIAVNPVALGYVYDGADFLSAVKESASVPVYNLRSCV